MHKIFVMFLLLISTMAQAETLEDITKHPMIHNGFCSTVDGTVARCVGFDAGEHLYIVLLHEGKPIVAKKVNKQSGEQENCWFADTKQT